MEEIHGKIKEAFSKMGLFGKHEKDEIHLQAECFVHAEGRAVHEDHVKVDLRIHGPGIQDVRQHYGYNDKGHSHLKKMKNKKIEIIFQD